MRFRTKISCLLLACFSVAAVACVEHRPLRNGLNDESNYLSKSELTSEGWLYKVTAVKASSPNVVGDLVWPGLESDLSLVNVRFSENSMQILDARRLQHDDSQDPNDDLATTTDRVMVEFKGAHVDVKLRETLDGERTNFLEENTEEPWMRRQKFKIDFEDTSLDPISNFAWYYGDFLKDCAALTGTSLVPNSFEWDPKSQHLSWVVEANYVLTVEGRCYDLVSLAHDVGTASIQYRFSFYRPKSSDYVPEVIGEKDLVNKKYGSFQTLNLFRDHDTGILSAKSLLNRWNPNREEPVVFYFHKGFPPRFKPMFSEIKEQTNEIFAQAGAKLRIDFREYNDGGIERNLGDIRYSFVIWHHDIDTTKGLLGYGPSSADPRTGELISANLNLYNIGLDYYRFMIQDYLEEYGALSRPDADIAWEDTACEEGATVATAADTNRLRSTLFDSMRKVMELDADTEYEVAADEFVPTPLKAETFPDDYHRVLSELRYGNPWWNEYVYHPTHHQQIPGFRDRLKKDAKFQNAMSNILMNESPFESTDMTGRSGVEAQLDFIDQMRDWRQNHERTEVDREMLLGLNNIYTFNDADAVSAIATGARRCLSDGYWESDEEYSERLIEDIVFKVAIHELGHNLSLRHNFYGSVDAKHMHEGEISSSVMDYVSPVEDAGTRRAWGDYDVAALTWIYGTQEARAEVMKEDFLYCTDEHRMNSPLCHAHDLGITPSQIVLNSIERYDWLYDLRNRRSYRTFWDTWGYVSRVYRSIFPIQRMWYLSIFDWGGGGVQDVLKRIDQVDGDRTVLSDVEYDEVAMDFYNDITAANSMIMAFYDAVINQPASFRNYQTEFDPFYGDILRLGIIVDKLFATFAFMDLQEVWNYDPNLYTYVAMYDAPFGTSNWALSQRVLDNMLGSNYDTFAWFRYTALAIFAYATNTNLIDSGELKERIAIHRYDNSFELELRFGPEALENAQARGNELQVFFHDGEEYVYTFLEDRDWHLVANRSRNPVSFSFMKDYNRALNTSASESMDNYGLKILLAYYEYFNNFVGF